MEDHKGPVSASRGDAVAALYVWQLPDPEDHAEFARDDELVRELAAEATPFFGQLHMDRVRTQLADGADAADGWSDWRGLCETRAREVLQVDDDVDVL